MNIGSRLKIARESIGYTQTKAAQESGIGESSISEFENSVREPKFSQLSKLAEVYKRSIEFFLSDKSSAEGIMLWRKAPSTAEQMKQTEAEFRQLCEQYHNLELVTNEKIKRPRSPLPDVDKALEFGYEQAEAFARKVQVELCLGDIPSTSLKRILEERYFVKIFYLSFAGSAISTVSPFGPAILLNADSKDWRRNYDLAHELFHLLAWDIFRTTSPTDTQPSEDEEKLANTFASKLLMPDEPLKRKLNLHKDRHGKISLDQLDDVAREFNVSLDALIYRIANLFNIKKEDGKKYIEIAKRLAESHKPRESNRPPKLPERYCDLALRALREGKLSLMQFAKYMDISYKKAQEYLTEEDGFTDGEIAISIA
jgi:Zn-dependent peptidase ImmA (M78 family)/transcriptional regulator with XRE-family HTH domain